MRRQVQGQQEQGGQGAHSGRHCNRARVPETWQKAREQAHRAGRKDEQGNKGRQEGWILAYLRRVLQSAVRGSLTGNLDLTTRTLA